MINFIVHFLIMAAAVWGLSLVVPGVRLRTFGSAISVSLVYSFFNWLFFKALIFITFPLVALKWLTLGLFGIAINAVLLIITDKVLDDFEMNSVGTAVVMAIGISVVNLILAASRFG